MTSLTGDFETSRALVAHQTDWEARTASSASCAHQSAACCVDQTIRYVSQHHENHIRVRTISDIRFKRQARGWTLSGTGRRTTSVSRSSFSIVEGMLSDSGRAYWVEQHQIFVNGQWNDGNEHTKVLVRGLFASVDGIFHGMRLCRLGSGDYVESRYDWFKRDKVLDSTRAKHVPRLLQQLMTKQSESEACGVRFEQGENGPVVIAGLVPQTIFGESRLAVGMPVVLLNQIRVETPYQAAEIIRQAHGIITVVTFRDTFVFDASLAGRLASTTLFKENAFAKTGIVFRKRGDALFISSVKEGSVAEEAGLQEFSRVWAINDQSYFETSQAAADLILNTTGYIHLVTDPTGSVDQPIDYDEDDTATAILVDTFPINIGGAVPAGVQDDETSIPLEPAQFVHDSHGPDGTDYAQRESDSVVDAANSFMDLEHGSG